MAVRSYVASATWLLSCVFAMGCSSGEDGPGVQSSAARIIGGTPATSYEEAVLVDVYQGATWTKRCSGTLIAPRVVLTAGHCIVGSDSWEVTAPIAGSQRAHGSRSAIFDYVETGFIVAQDQHDLAIVHLDSPIAIASYPEVAAAPVPDGTLIVNVGRVQEGAISDSMLFQGPPIPAMSAAGWYPYDYQSSIVLQPGDSGGGVFLPETSPHVLVAVNSGHGTDQQMLARVDLLKSWIDHEIAGAGPTGNESSADPASTGSSWRSRRIARWRR